jgi:hypothetical protein
VKLDRLYIKEEIAMCAIKLKSDKVPGYDNVDSFLDIWTKSVLVVSFRKRKRSVHDTNNYREVSLVSNVRKLLISDIPYVLFISVTTRTDVTSGTGTANTSGACKFSRGL